MTTNTQLKMQTIVTTGNVLRLVRKILPNKNVMAPRGLVTLAQAEMHILRCHQDANLVLVVAADPGDIKTQFVLQSFIVKLNAGNITGGGRQPSLDDRRRSHFQ